MATTTVFLMGPPKESHVPYRMKQRAGRWLVVNPDTDEVVPGGDHPNRPQALKHLRRLYANVRDAGDGTFAVVDWFTGETVATLNDELAAFDVYDIMVVSGQLTDAIGAEELATLGKAGKAFRNANGEWSYPTPNAAYVRKAMQAFGRSNPKDRTRLKAYLKRRAKAEGLSEEEIARIDDYTS